MLILGEVLKRNGISQVQLARQLRLSPAAINLLVKRGQYPRKTERRVLRSMVLAALRGWGVVESELVDCFFEPESPEVGGPGKSPVTPQGDPANEVTAPRGHAAPSGTTAQPKEVESEMLLRKQTLSEAARRKFSIFRDPFDDPQQASEVYLSRAIRTVREAMWQVAIGNTKFLAVIGESGAGKSTLREEMEERLRLECRPVRLIQPYVLAMEDSDKKGKTLRSDHIAEAMLHAVASGEAPKRSPEARFRQVHEALTASSRVGMQHLLVIEEAHGLALPTLKHLKRFLELKDGMRRLVSVLLLGQPELRDKLDERRAAVREVAQRCQIVWLPPLDTALGEYLQHRFTAVGLDLSAIVEPAAVDALMQALTLKQRVGAGAADTQVISLTHPLVADNLLTAAINQAALLGAPRVTADLVRAVRESMP
ncbi:MAG: AAA family ATPase [Candidatus Accumulibacter propinquus]|jgi:type II secretory pathway predicted ATPase ExeA|uniref:ExeA family protein n=1 Tax=Candidatus Accumulibacter propinquus TaxID=2954380 RepID=UPI002FC2F158